MLFSEKSDPLFIFSLFAKRYKSLYAYMGRAGDLTGCGTSFVDSVGTRHALGIELECRFSITQAFIKLICCLNRTDLGTLAAGCTFIQVNKSGALPEVDLEVAWIS